MPFGGLLSAGIGAAGSLFGGLFGGAASSKASHEYIQALNAAEQWQKEELQQGLNNYSPYQNAGQSGAMQLRNLMGDVTAPWTGTFKAPTAAEAEATPGFQFQLKQGEDAIQNSAAGKGSLLTGRTLSDLNNFAQGTASANYQNVFNNVLTQYRTAYQSFLNNQQNTYNRLLGMSDLGLQAASGEGNLISGIGGNIASLMGQAGAAQAAGTIGAANAYGSILPGIGNSISSGLTLGSLLENNTGNSTTSFNPNIWMGTPSYMPGGGGGFSPTLPGFDPNGTGMLPLSALNSNSGLQLPATTQY